MLTQAIKKRRVLKEKQQQKKGGKMPLSSYRVKNTGVAVITIDNPPVNVLNSATIDALQKSVSEVITDKSARVAVITGNGKGFVAGADINELASIENIEKASEYIRKAANLMNLISESPKPFIAAIRSFSLGGGLELALACHIRIADESAKIGFPELGLGIIPGFGGTQRAARLTGIPRALELILSAEIINAKKASDYGLINYTVPDGNALDESIRLAETIAGNSMPAVAAAMTAVKKGNTMTLEKGLDFEIEEFMKIFSNEDRKEGIKAFIEKRKPLIRDR